jgi:hypothetical protein
VGVPVLTSRGGTPLARKTDGRFRHDRIAGASGRFSGQHPLMANSPAEQSRLTRRVGKDGLTGHAKGTAFALSAASTNRFAVGNRSRSIPRLALEERRT